jgi:acetyl esterase
MPLDPEAQMLLAQFEAMGAKPFEDMTVPEAREAAAAFLDLQGPPEHVASVDHCFIPGPTADIPACIYTPEGAGAGARPAIVYFHGSGWTILNIALCDPTMRSLANRSGCVVVAVNYQKAPEHKFPIPFDDCYTATCWVAANAERLGIDPNRLAVGGDSAGGNLAAAVCLRARDTGGPRIAFQALVYPATDYGWDTPSCIENAEGYLLQRGSMQWFWTNYVNDPSDGENPYVSPLRAPDLSGLPPAFIATAGFDPLRDDGLRYGDRLREAGVPVKVTNYETMIHGFFFMLGVLGESKRLHDEIATELRAALAV